jgi:serine/threonine protein kinase
MTTQTHDESDLLPVWPLDPGETSLGDHLVIERLGVGYRCETWLAWSSALWAPVVLKVVRPHQVTHPRALATLRREVAAIEGVTHPALPGLVSAHLDDPVPHVVTEYVDGPTLADVIDDDGPLTPEETALLGTQLLSALAQLHRRGLAHLDVKPENVVLRDGRPVLIDFGSSRRLGSLQPAGKPVGTVGYSAPEMEGCEPIAVSMDLFGLGATLAESLAGVPYPEITGLPASPLASVVERLLADDPSSRGTVPQLLLDLADRCGPDRPWPAWADPSVTAL